MKQTCESKRKSAHNVRDNLSDPFNTTIWNLLQKPEFTDHEIDIFGEAAVPMTET